MISGSVNASTSSGGIHGEHRTARLHQRRSNGCARIYGGRRRGTAHAARRALAGRSIPDVDRRAGRSARSAGRDACSRCPAGGDFPLRGSAALDPGGASAARSADPQRAAALCGFLPDGARGDRSCEPSARNGRRFAQLNESERREFVDAMRQNKIDGWQGPAGGFVYIVLRNDAVDVVYGTMEGYAALGIPYMPHIAPTKRW